jgi:hypothetical protein
MVRRRSPSLPGNFLNYLTTLALVDTFLILLFLLDNIIINHHEEHKDDWYYTAGVNISQNSRRLNSGKVSGY